jgi:hypothetical protein
MSNQTISLLELKARARQLGEENAKGADTQIKFHLSVFEGAYHGVLDKTKDKHGPGIDDATLLSKEYFEGRNKTVIWDSKAPNQRKLISTARADMRGGKWEGDGDVLNMVHKLMSIWQNMRKVPANSGKMEDAANVLHRTLRVLLKRDAVLEDAELRALCLKESRKPRDLEKFWTDTAEMFQKLKVGSLASSTLQDDDPAVTSIRELCVSRVDALREQRRLEAEEEATATAEAAEEAKGE